MGALSDIASTTNAEPTSVSSTTPNPVASLRGHVTRGTYGKGSKSERVAVFLETPDARYVLRRKSGPVFGDDELEPYVGHNVECDGFVVGTTLLAERILVVK
jgi:hypothetical protein